METMKPYQFKKLEIKSEDHWIKRTIGSAQFKKTIITGLVGALIGLAIYYLSEGISTSQLWSDEAAEHLLMGLGFGVFISNSPCARGRCNTNGLTK